MQNFCKVGEACNATFWPASGSLPELDSDVSV